MAKHRPETVIVWLIGAALFVHVLDFMIVMPLGPDFGMALGIGPDKLGAINGSYTAAAALVGILAAPFLDRFDRRRALALCMLGLVVGTALGGLAQGLTSLVAARVFAGAFGGPATSLAFAIVGDSVPVERRGAALGAVMGAYALASVVGVPAALQIATWGGWRAPFFATALLGLGVWAGVMALLPPMTGHFMVDGAAPEPQVRALWRMVKRREVIVALVLSFNLNVMHFVVTPNFSAYVQYNLAYPRAQLGLLWLAGGVANFVAMRLLGRATDAYGPFTVTCCAVVATCLVAYGGFVQTRWAVPAMAVFVTYMVATSGRTVPFNALMSQLPLPQERARFMSLQSAMHHLGAAVGAFLGVHMLVALPDHRLVGMGSVAWVCMGLALTLPPLVGWLAQRQHATA